MLFRSRRFVHYDYWSDALRRSILIDSQADLLVYGMGERQILEIAGALSDGVPVDAIRNVKGTCYAAGPDGLPEAFVELPSWKEISASRSCFAEAYRISSLEQDPHNDVGGRHVAVGHAPLVQVRQRAPESLCRKRRPDTQKYRRLSAYRFCNNKRL